MRRLVWKPPFIRLWEKLKNSSLKSVTGRGFLQRKINWSTLCANKLINSSTKPWPPQTSTNKRIFLHKPTSSKNISNKLRTNSMPQKLYSTTLSHLHKSTSRIYNRLSQKHKLSGMLSWLRALLNQQLNSTCTSSSKLTLSWVHGSWPLPSIHSLKL